MELSAFKGLIGVIVLLAIAIALSNDKKNINFRTVTFAFCLQILLGAFVLYVPFGKDVLEAMTMVYKMSLIVPKWVLIFYLVV